MPDLAGRPIRLVEFAKSFHLGGTEVQVLELLRGLPSRYDVRVGVLEEVGPLLESVWQLGIFPEEFRIRHSLARPGTAVQIARIALWLQRHRIDLVHAHDFYSSVLVVPAAKMAGVKVIVGRLDLAHWHGPGQRALLRQVTRAADHVVANDEAIRRMVIAEGVPPEKVTVISNGIDLARFDRRMAEEPEAAVPPTGGLPVVVQVANMSHPVKRQEDLLAALSIVNAERPRLHAFFVGDGKRRPALQRLARELGVAQVAHFLGRRMDVPALYARAQLGVSCSSAEGLSNAVIEGMAARLPMVVTSVGGNPDLILDGDRGLVVHPGRPMEMAQALRRLLDSPKERRRMGERARAFVEQRLTLRRMIAEHDALYREVLRGTMEAPLGELSPAAS